MNDISYLEIHEGDGGFYLYQFKDISEPPFWDVFADDIEDLFDGCRETWKIDISDWKSI